MKATKTLEVRKEGEWIIASNASVDRDKDRVMPMGIDISNFQRNPVLIFGHNYHEPWAVIGRAAEIRLSPESLDIRPELRKPANDSDPMTIISSLWDAGLLRAASIGFIPKKGKPNSFGGTDFEEVELLEISLVPLPANQDALRLAVKGLNGERADDVWADAALRTITDQSLTNPMRADRLKTIEEWRAKFSSPIPQITLRNNTKSPACRQADETEAECRSRKIPEILEENPDMDMGQVVAMASRMCSEMCEGKDAEGDKSRKQTMAEHMDSAMAALDKCRTHLGAMADMLPEGEGAGADSKALQTKRGRVLSAKNEQKIKDAVTGLQEVLAQLEAEPHDLPRDDDKDNPESAKIADLASLLDADGERDLADSLHILTDLVKGVMK